MLTPKIYIAYTPRGAGLLGAAAWFSQGIDVCGWFVGAVGYEATSAYFKLANFFSTEPTLFYATAGDDLYAGWQFDYSLRARRLDAALRVDDETCHRLAQLQETFRGEWLFYRDDPGSAREVERYHEISLPVQTVNIKAARLNKLDQSAVIWTYFSPGAERVVVDYLLPRWPLDYKG